MSGPLKKPLEFRGKRGKGLPGQSPDEGDLGLDISFKILDRPTSTVFEKELVLIGSIGAGRYLEIGTDGVKIFTGGKLKIYLQADGDVFVGDDLSDPSKTYFSIFSNAQTYNSESVSAGDMLIGDNSASKANMLWDKSAGRLLFRGGQAAEAYVDTDGSIVAGDGDVFLDSDGLTLLSGTGTPNQVKVVDGSDTIFLMYSRVDGNASQLTAVSQGKDSGDPEALFTFQAITHDGTAHGGAAQVYLSLDTANDEGVLSAQIVRGMKVLRLTGITTTQRGNLPYTANGMLIYNSTTNKFQGRAGGSWVDLH